MISLDHQQAKAVKTESGRALVLAGAGSGKTRVLTERIAYLIEQKQTSPYEICAFTFTRKAAGEMKSRLEKRIESQAHKVTMGTMHSIALDMIHKMGELIGLRNKQVTVYSEWETNYLIKTVAMETGYFRKKWDPPKKEIDQMFAHYYQNGVEPEAIHPAHDLFKAFYNRCRENNALTYGDLLIGFRMLIPHLAKHFHWKHILVDEVQDIDVLQWSIIHGLCEAFGASLFVVGDIDQSIYEWRGAVPQYLVSQQAEFDIYRIERNYRSDANIVNAANNLIKNNHYRLEKTMVPFEDAQTEIKILKDMDSARIVMKIEELKQNTPKAFLAVLARQHVLLKKVSMLLNQAGIDHVYIGQKTALTNSEEFRRFHAFLKLIVNPYDNFSFLLIKDILGVSRETYHRIRLEAAEKGQSHFQIYRDILQANDFATMCQGSSFLDTVMNIESIIQIETEFETSHIVDFCIQNEKESVHNYLKWLATYDLQDEIREESEGLQLMTIHAAKGLEWPTVILAGVNEGLIPSKQAINNDEIESERRLMYVAITRAEDSLILAIRPDTKTSKSGKVYHNPVSRFVEEMTK